MKLRFIYAMVLFLGAFYSSFAQEITITGVVKDENREPVPGASVFIKNARRGVTTDFDGNYSIQANVGETLIFTYVGMKQVERKITGARVINVTLETDVQEIEGVVVIGYGSGRKMTSLTGSVAKIDMKNFADAPSANALDALQGKVAGLNISSTSGEPGSSSNIMLHGEGSIIFWQEGYTTPLFVLDGNPVSDGIVTSMNPNDFESVTVLKDASATSIYGARAANGVIYITTKKGRRNEKGTVTINTQIGFSNLYSRKFYNDLMTSQEYMDFLVDKGTISRDIADYYLEEFPNNTRWDEVYFKRNVPTSQTSVSVSGGSERTTYYISGGYFNQEGVMYRSGYNRYTLNANIDSQLNNWLQVGLSLSTGTSESSTAYSSGADTPLLNLPIYSFYDGNGKMVDQIETLTGGLLYNPRYLADKNPVSTQSEEIIPTGYVKIEPLENLIFKTQGGIQYNVSEYEGKQLPSLQQTPRTMRSLSKYLSKTLTNTLEYSFSLNKSHFTALVGQESIYTQNTGFEAISYGQKTDNQTMLRHGATGLSVEDSKSITTFNSYFSRIDYNYDNRYFLDLSARRDGSSRFGKNNRYADFWAVGLLWRAKNESFLKDVNWLDLLNIKFSTGISGVASVPDYSSLSLINTSSQYGNQLGYVIQSLGNPDLQWEKQRKTNVGFSLGMFKRISLEVDLYNRVTKDMLGSEQLPLTSGFSLYPKNVAEVQNRGIDVTFSAVVLRNTEKNIFVRPYINFNYNSQEVLELFPVLERTASTSVGSNNTIFKTGAPLTYGLPIFRQVNPDTGAPEWYNRGEDLRNAQTDDNNVTNAYNYALLAQDTGKKKIPPFNGGFGFNASYGAFSLQVGFAFSQGKYMINNDRLYTDNLEPLYYNVSRRALNYWKEVGDQAEFPATMYGRALQLDSRLLEDASYIRLKDVSLSYTLPREVISQIGFFDGIRFYASGRNLLTFTNYSGADPEFNVNASLGGYPSMKQYSFGVEVKF